MSSPTQRSLAHLRKLGCPLVQVVEKWNPHARIRQDLFGIIDVLAIGPEGDGFSNNEIIGVQATSDSNVAARVRKIAESQAIVHLRRANIRVLVHGWRKNTRGRWQLREVDCS